MKAPLLILLIYSQLALAQPPAPQTRAEQIDQQRRDPQQLAQPQPDKFESVIGKVENSAMNFLSGGLNGFGLKVGGLVTSAGFSLGPTFNRRDLLNENLRLRISAVASFKQYYMVDGLMSFPRLLGKRLQLDFYGAHSDSPQLPYYGPGNDSRLTGRTDFRLEQTNADFRLGWRVVRRHVFVGVTGGFNAINVGPGTAKVYASADKTYSPLQAPGIDRQTNYFHVGPFIQVDFRDRKDDPHRGANFVVRYSDYNDTKRDLYSFHRLESLYEQYIPFFNEKRVIALRARTDLSYIHTNAQLPFYLQPTVGGSDDLRGFRQFRFFDNNALFANVEYRWEVAPVLDVAIFADAGRVFHRPGEFKLTGLHEDAGFGLRFKTRDSVAFRIDTGFSREGFQLWFKFSPPFTGLFHGIF